jgi:hypothetical protein
LYSLPGGGVFYDLGSGTGKTVIGAAALLPLRRACGLELLPGLHAVAMSHRDAWNGMAADANAAASNAAAAASAAGTDSDTDDSTDTFPAPVTAPVPAPATTIDFIAGSILDPSVCDWSDGDLVFANSHCFGAPMMEQLSRLAG